MAVFPVLEIEDRLQVGDKTRLSAVKSFVAPASATAINSIKITPSTGAEQEVWSADDQDKWFLDWKFTEAKFDIVVDLNDSIYIDVEGDQPYLFTAVAGQYTLSELAQHLQSRMNAATPPGTFTVSKSAQNKITIAYTAADFTIDPGTDGSLLPHLGFTAITRSTNKSMEGDEVEYATVSVKLVATNGTETKEVTQLIKLYTAKGDYLFSADGDLTTWEPDIMQWVPKGRSSYLNIHREAQDQIMNYLDKEGYTDYDQKKFGKRAFVDMSEVQDWSAFLTLSIIFWGLSNKKDDVFLDKYKSYQGMAKGARERLVLRLDKDGDGEVDDSESIGFREGVIVRR